MGMILCASNAAHDAVECVDVPENSVVGERIQILNTSSASSSSSAAASTQERKEPLSAAQMKKQKVLENLLPKLQTNAELLACFDGQPVGNAKGSPCTVASLTNANIS